MKPFEKLLAWQTCHKLLLKVYDVTGTWPTEERYGLVAQTRRPAFSAAANIAEGSAKQGHREFRRFLDSSLGSLAELRYIILVAKDLGLLDEEQAKALEAVRDEAGRLTWGPMPMYGRQCDTATPPHCRTASHPRRPPP